MKGYRGVNLVVILALLLVRAETTFAERFAFFCKDCARTVFDSPRVESTANRGFAFFPQRAEQKNEQAAKAPGKVQKEQNQPADKAASAQDKKDLDDLLKKYGDPDKDFPVLAKSDAPKPFQGMMAALDKGDDELAFKYARQYVRYLHRLNSRSLQVTGIVGKALQSEGLSAGDDWTSSPEYDRYNYLLQKSIKDERAIIRNNKDTAEHFLKAAKAFLKEQKEAEANLGAKALRRKEEGSDSKSIKEELLKAGVPVDPAGKVDVMLFIKPRDRESIKAAQALQLALNRAQKKFNVIALTPMQESNSNLIYFRAKSRSRFPIHNGEKLAKALNLRSYPQLVATARTLGKSYTVIGAKSANYYLELIKLMQGNN